MPEITRRVRPLLGTFVEIRLRQANPAVFDEAFAQIEQLQNRMSAHSSESDLAKIARSAHHGPVEVDVATAEVIACGLEWAAASDGAFDPVRAGVRLVHAGRRPWFADALPDRCATWRDLVLDGLKVRAVRPLALDLGGIAKGYAVDRAAAIIATHGISGIVNAGGDLRFIGDEPRVAFIKKPDAAGEHYELREIPFPALATTGSYGFSQDGGNLDLIGPADDQIPQGSISITVFAANCALADALTKAVLNLPTGSAKTLLEQFSCTALILESGGRHRELP